MYKIGFKIERRPSMRDLVNGGFQYPKELVEYLRSMVGRGAVVDAMNPGDKWMLSLSGASNGHVLFICYFINEGDALVAKLGWNGETWNADTIDE